VGPGTAAEGTHTTHLTQARNQATPTADAKRGLRTASDGSKHLPQRIRWCGHGDPWFFAQ